MNPKPVISTDTNARKEQQFLEAYDAYADALFRHCFFRVSNRETAKDITQETFERTWRYLAERGDIENIRAFLYRTAHNLIVDTYRLRGHNNVSYEQLLEVGFEPGASTEPPSDPIEIERALTALHALKKEDQRIITLRYVDGFGPSEIARMMGIHENAVSVRLHRALKRARTII